MVYSREKKVNKDALVLINVNSSFFYFLTNLGPMSLAILLKHENLFILICPGWGLNSDLWDYKLPNDPPLLVSNFVNFMYFLYFCSMTTTSTSAPIQSSNTNVNQTISCIIWVHLQVTNCIIKFKTHFNKTK